MSCKFVYIIFVLFGLMTSAYAQPAEVPKTGQTQTFSPGDDGSLQIGVAWPSPRFIVNTDTTLTDQLTGLSWAPEADSPSITGCTGGKKAWTISFDYVDCLNSQNYLGHDDWRVPNINELRSLVNYAQQYPSIWLNSMGFTDVKGGSDNYWSSTTLANTDTNGDHVWSWIISFYDGIMYYTKNTTGFSQWVWPVRGPENPGAVSIPKTGQTTIYYLGDDGDLKVGAVSPAPRFAANPDSTISDGLTGLIWTVNANLMPSRDPGWDTDSGDDGRVTWQHALDYITKLNNENYLGHRDWRLPNVNEMGSLGDFSQVEPSLPSVHPFLNVQCNSYTDARYYWTSTTRYESSVAWYYNMYEGQLGNALTSQRYFVWPVRGAPSGSNALPAIPLLLLSD